MCNKWIKCTELGLLVLDIFNAVNLAESDVIKLILIYLNCYTTNSRNLSAHASHNTEHCLDNVIKQAMSSTRDKFSGKIQLH